MTNSASMLQDSGIALHIFVRDVREAAWFYPAAFGAEFLVHEESAGRSSLNARFRIGNSLLNVSTDGDFSNQAQRGPGAKVGVGTCFELFVTDIDAALNRALKAGATVLKDARTHRPLREDYRFIVDPFGYIWCVSAFMNDGGALCV
ncbi:MAG TPA: VOC family protein [Bryobacteraceae bacterium]|jgi:uncharacterized glyoxalase superfamily protein PhnB